MAQTKATKKFEKNHLKDTIKRRKEGAKIRQKQQIKAKRKARNAEDNEKAEAVGEPTNKDDDKPQQNGNSLADMSVDEFFQRGFDLPEQLKGKGERSKEVSSVTGKRKRSELAQEDGDESSSGVSIEGNPVVDDSGSDRESTDGMGAHKEQLDALAKNDPEFFKYLQENDAELLGFAEDANLAEVDALSETEGEEEEPKRKKQTKTKTIAKAQVEFEGETEMAGGSGNEVTKAMVAKWKTAMTEHHSLRSMREVVLAFRAAAHLNEDEGKEYKYSISNSDVYHELLVIALSYVPEVLQHHLPVKETGAGNIRVPTEIKKYRTLTPLLKSHATSVYHLLANLSDAATLRMTLSSLTPLLPYILSFKKLVRDLVRTVVSIWSEPSNTEATRISAFLVLRRLTVIGDPGIREAVLKTTFQGLVKGSRNTTIHTLAGVNLMKNSAAELWGLDPMIGYTTGFTLIRQLAIHLRSSITNNSNESYKTVYNWQYVHSLDFWSRVLATHCSGLAEARAGKQSPLRPLIYPVVQTTLGAMRLIPTATYFPLRLHLIRSLLRVSDATDTYIPLASSLYEVLNSAEMRKAPKNSTLKALDFATSIRAPKSYLRTRVYQTGVGEQIQELLSEFFTLWTKSIAFPELALPVTVMLKRWLKDVSNKATGNKNGKVNSMIVLLLQKLEANSRWIEERRAKVEYAPDDRAGVERFLKDIEWAKTPLGAFVVGQRKTREERTRLVEEGRKAEERTNQRDREDAKRTEVADGFDDDESGAEDDSDGDGGDE
ncbi:ribosome assembly protein-like protein Noc2 [Cryomyces antarcticus]